MELEKRKVHSKILSPPRKNFWLTPSIIALSANIVPNVIREGENYDLKARIHTKFTGSVSDPVERLGMAVLVSQVTTYSINALWRPLL